MRFQFTFSKVLVVAMVAAMGVFLSPQGAAKTVEVVPQGDGWQLLRNGKPYVVHGAGVNLDNSLLTFKQAGGNSIRTWGSQDWGKALSRARRWDMTVCAGAWLGQPRQGFDYGNSEAVRSQKENVLASVRRYKDDPNVLIWGIGNEMEGDGKDARIWQAIEDIAAGIKKIDPNHPTMTVVAEATPDKIAGLNKYCPSIDVLGINSYAGLESLGRRVKEAGWKKPFIVTEWGARGWWESGKTAWDVPIEQSSTERAEWAKQGYEATIKNNAQCLGSYVFMWGNKQERTSTWFGLLSPDGETNGLVDTLAQDWTGKPLANSAPHIDQFNFLGADKTLASGAQAPASVAISDPNGDKLQVMWEVREETKDARSGGDAEAVPREFPAAVVSSEGVNAKVQAPSEPGPYRLFVWVFDNKGGFATANIPFLVK